MCHERILADECHCKKTPCFYPDIIHYKILPNPDSGLWQAQPFLYLWLFFAAKEEKHLPSAATSPNDPHKHALRIPPGSFPST